MKLAIIHISDIHYRENTKLNYLDRKIVKLAGAIRAKTVGIKDVLIVTTGDVAFSGKRSEYEQALLFYEKLLKEISIDEKKQIKFIFVPGNHDCDFSDDQTERDNNKILLLENQISVTECSDDFMKVQSNFCDFISESIFECGLHGDCRQKLFNAIIMEIDSIRIVFNLLNTSWISQIDEKQGQLYYPVEAITIPENTEKPDNLVVSILHHPYAWYQPENSRRLRNKLDSISDIILTGHEHESEVYEKIRRNGETTEYIEGGVLQDNSLDNSEFNILIVDFQEDIKEIFTYKWNGNKTIYEPVGKPLINKFICNPLRPNLGKKLTDHFEKELNDIGMKFSHPNVDNLFIDDLYVFPNLRKLATTQHQQLSNAIINMDIEEYILENKLLLIYGAERSGKTLFSKMIFRKFLEKGHCPILINGNSIKSSDANRIENLLKRLIELEYNKPDINEYLQLPKSKRVVIIDDFHKSNLNHKGREKVILYLRDYFEYIIIIGSTELRLDELVIAPDDIPEAPLFVECEIIAFGHVKRSELIKKWLVLGQDEYSNLETDTSQTLVRTERLISSIIGKNFLPSYPIYILLILQQLEVGTSSNTTSGSIGYLYETLLTLSLSKVGSKGRDLDKQYSYLSELAYKFFSDRTTLVSRDKLLLYHNQYCDKYKLTIDLSQIISIFVNASIMKEEVEGFGFKYPYIYYYFVARYLRDHINEQRVKEQITNMSQRLHQTLPANIIIFLCYLSKDPFILITLLESAKQIYSNYNEFDVISDSKFLADMFTEIPNFLLDSDNTDENQKNELEKKDKAEQENNKGDDIDTDDGDNKSDLDLEEFLQINVAVKRIQILGQLLKNFPGSWEGQQKLELVQNCYSIGLRVLKFVFTMVESNQERTIKRTAELLKENNPKWESQKIYDGVRIFVFSLLESMAYWLMQHIAESVGHTDFEMTYKELIDINPDNISYKFIDLFIKLDYYNEFPEDLIFEMAKTVHKNSFATFLVRHSVWYYFYIFKANQLLKQSVCDKMGIQISVNRKPVQKHRYGYSKFNKRNFK